MLSIDYDWAIITGLVMLPFLGILDSTNLPGVGRMPERERLLQRCPNGLGMNDV